MIYVFNVYEKYYYAVAFIRTNTSLHFDLVMPNSDYVLVIHFIIIYFVAN